MHDEFPDKDINGVLVIDLKGRLDSANAAAFADRLYATLVRPRGRLLINLQEVDYISSAGFRTLLVISRHASKSNSKLVLSSLAPNVQALFELGGFLDRFEIKPTREDGLAALG
jgi:anti-anti-sigma factor